MSKRVAKKNTARLNADIRAKKMAIKDIKSECGDNRFFPMFYLDYEDNIVYRPK